MSELHDLFTLANLSEDEVRDLADKLVQSHLKRAEWTASGGNLLGPLQVGWDTFPDVPGISSGAYKALLGAASDKILDDLYKIRDLQDELMNLKMRFKELEKKVAGNN